jgi:hydroxymethylbilane synthase
LIRIGSRGSALALWQSNHVRDRLLEAHPGLEIEIEVIKTTGDKILDVPLAKIGDKGLFTKELDMSLLENRIDLAVHSLKDVPTRVEPGLTIAAVSEREDPSDALIVAPGRPGKLRDLPAGARVGTSSLRRRAQLLALREDLDVQDLRGNVDTRLAQVAAGKYDAIILARAGIKRLGFDDRASELLGGEYWLPAVGQGALGIICRQSDARTREVLAILHDDASYRATTAERTFLRELEGGCQVPIAALGVVTERSVKLRGLVASIDGTRVLRGTSENDDPREAGLDLARQLLQRGAAEILEEVRSMMQQSPPPAAP